MNSDFPHFQLSEEHDDIRAAVRAVAENKIAPYAAAVDADMRYPRRPTTPSSRPTSSPPRR